jgi:hypothetical protein
MDVQIVGRVVPIGLTIQGATTVNADSTTAYTATASYDDGSSKVVSERSS